MQMQSEERMQSVGLHFLDERMQKPFLLDGIVTKSSVFYYSLCINAKMQREKKYAKTNLMHICCDASGCCSWTKTRYSV